MRIEKLSEDYLVGKAYVHFTAWNETYNGLISNEYLSKRSLENCLELAKRLYFGNRENCYIAIINNEVVGFIAFDNDYQEIRGLYVLKKYQGQGIGKNLINIVLLKTDKVKLFVLDKNIKTIEFYKHMGFKLTGNKKEEDLKVTKIIELEMIKEKKANV